MVRTPTPPSGTTPAPTPSAPTPQTPAERPPPFASDLDLIGDLERGDDIVEHR